MNASTVKLAETEWTLMNCLWEQSPKTGRELIDELSRKVGWSRSTTLTLLTRLEAKGAIRVDTSGKVKAYSPAISREEAAIKETTSLIDRIYQGSLSTLVSTLTKRQSLSQKEINELHAILNELEAKTDD